MNDQQPFTPSADSIQTAWVLMCQQSRISTQPPVEELEAEFDRFLARVRQGAKAEALREAASARIPRDALASQTRGWLRTRAYQIEREPS